MMTGRYESAKDTTWNRRCIPESSDARV
jgi:hypothetical protein